MNILSLLYLSCFFLFFLLYWIGGITAKWQNLFIITAGLLLYISWSGYAVLLLLSVCLISFFAAKYISISSERTSRVIRSCSIITLVGILFLFKYYNFFAGELFNLLQVEGFFLSLILPVGISFYIFTNIGYILDVKKHVRKPESDLLDYMSFGTFFPLIMSGPIERSTTLLPQFKVKRIFNYVLVVDGAQQIIWGLFKKMVIADNCSSVVNFVFPNYESQPASALIIGAILYSFQIYFDFSGYSDIAIGFSKMLGFKVKNNFHYPYFAINISDFWRRWHMSLQRWFTDYIYFPLGGSRCSKSRTIFNTFVVFTICGIWHGANWTFIVWGVYNAILFVPYILYFKDRTKRNIADATIIPGLTDSLQLLVTFIFVTIGWIIFNSVSIADACAYIVGCFDFSTMLIAPEGIGLSQIYTTIGLLLLVLIFEWVEKDKDYAMQAGMPKWLRVCILYFLIYLLIFNRAGTADFIYLQF